MYKDDRESETESNFTLGPNMQDIERRKVRNFFIIIVAILCVFAATACTVQMAHRNKNTDCGFTSDRISPHAQKDPMIFYGNPKSNK